jgi:hypothetical protein
MPRRMFVFFLGIALTGCTSPPVIYVPETPAAGVRDPGIQVSISGGQGNILSGQVNQTPPPGTPPVLSQIPNNAVMTIVDTAGDSIAGVSEIEIDMERRTCIADGNGGTYTADTGANGAPPLVQYTPPTKGSASQPTVPVAVGILSLVNVGQDLATPPPGSTTPLYEVDYQFIGRAKNGLDPQGVTTAAIWFYATADGKPTTHGCLGPPFR